MRRAATLAVLGALLSAPAALAADPAGMTVWKGQGFADTLLENQHSVRFDHLSEMHFANGRSAFTTIGGPTTYVFSGSTPLQHGKHYEFAVDTIDIAENGSSRKTFHANGSCEVKGQIGHAIHELGCGADAAGGPSLSLTFIADKTAPDFKSFDPAKPGPSPARVLRGSRPGALTQ